MRKSEGAPLPKVCCVRRRGDSSVTTVDIMVGDDIFSGKVRDTCTTEKELSIVFGRKNSGRFPFGSIYLRQNQNLLCAEGQIGKPYARSIDQGEEFVAEAVMSFGGDGSWKRYPATLLMGDFALYSFGLLQVHLPNGPITTVLRCNDIHAPFDRKSTLGSTRHKR
ncbi:uncharacterized protein LOC129593983 [Paramacrobiotus metropolitanus]|uniref:uncharacterized protein LOC129593983 n=1 Tax=Paramacrobiotus metropolitanus TaxID=2943436 RepID=UPI002445CDEC|nr:uncharacterized protein LOC129593983 [Paramacrobiotus metropolitanus]